MSTAIGTQVILTLNGVDNLSAVLAAAGGSLASFRRTAAASGTLAAQSFSLTTAAAGKLSAVGALVNGVVQRAISGAIGMANEMGALSDRAQDAGTTTQELQKLTGAMQNFGVKGASVEMVSRALQEMTKRTGKQGAQGFAEILGSIARVNDAQERAAMLADAFGNTAGMALQALVADGVEGLNAGLFETMGRFHAASDEAVMAGDAIADKWNEVQFGLKNGFMAAIGSIWSDFDSMLGDTQVNLSKWISTGVRWIADAFRAVFKAGQTVGIALRGVFNIVLEPFKALWQAAGLALDGDFRAAGRRLAEIGPNIASEFQERVEETLSVWDADLFALPADALQESMGEALKEAAREGTDEWRAGLSRGAADAASRRSGGAADRGPSFASAMGFGSDAVRRFLFGASRPDQRREELAEARRTNDILTDISGSLAALEAV